LRSESTLMKNRPGGGGITSFPRSAFPAPLATLFHTWLANASANTSLPISTGAKKSRAPFASRRIPWRHSLATIEVSKPSLPRTINIVGSKLARGTADYGYLSVVTQFYTRPEFVFEIPRHAFNPPPEVTSALVTLRLPGERAKLSLASCAPPAAGTQAHSSRGADSRFLDFVKLCFSQKRK